MTTFYAVDGTYLTLPPSKARWLDDKAYDSDGYGRPLYPGMWQFEFNWQTMPAAVWGEINALFQGTSPTGTATVALPKRRSYSSVVFQPYHGCFFDEPTHDAYFDGFHLGVKMVVNVPVTENADPGP